MWGCSSSVQLLAVGVVFHDLGFFTELGGLLKYVRPFLNSISKAKAARLVRSLLDLFLDMEAATGQEVRLQLQHQAVPQKPATPLSDLVCFTLKNYSCQEADF